MTVAQGAIYSLLAYDVLHSKGAVGGNLAKELDGRMWHPIRLNFDTISAETGVPSATAYRSIAKLKDMGYINDNAVNVNLALHSRFFPVCEIPESIELGLFPKVLYSFLRANSCRVDDGVRICTDRRRDLVDWLGCCGQNFDLTLRKLEKDGYVKRCDGAIRLVDLYYCLKSNKEIRL